MHPIGDVDPGLSQKMHITLKAHNRFDFRTFDRLEFKYRISSGLQGFESGEWISLDAPKGVRQGLLEVGPGGSCEWELLLEVPTGDVGVWLQACAVRIGDPSFSAGEGLSSAKDADVIANSFVEAQTALTLHAPGLATGQVDGTVLCPMPSDPIPIADIWGQGSADDVASP